MTTSALCAIFLPEKIRSYVDNSLDNREGVIYIERHEELDPDAARSDR